jgi:hypothetical protein
MMNTETKCNKKIKTSLHENIDRMTNATRLRNHSNSYPVENYW